MWDGSEIEQQWLDWLEDRSFTTLFVSGNHENYDLLRSYPTSVWHGGLVQPIRPSVLLLMRGQLYEICGKKVFTMGGASSHDIRDGILEPDDPNYERKLRQLNAAGALYRINHRSWWKKELPSAVSYTHLTLPTKRIAGISVAPVPSKKKTTSVKCAHKQQ